MVDSAQEHDRAAHIKNRRVKRTPRSASTLYSKRRTFRRRLHARVRTHADQNLVPEPIGLQPTVQPWFRLRNHLPGDGPHSKECCGHG